MEINRINTIKILTKKINELIDEQFSLDRERLKKEYLQNGYKNRNSFQWYQGENYNRELYHLNETCKIKQTNKMYVSEENKKFIKKVDKILENRFGVTPEDLYKLEDIFGEEVHYNDIKEIREMLRNKQKNI